MLVDDFLPVYDVALAQLVRRLLRDIGRQLRHEELPLDVERHVRCVGV